MGITTMMRNKLSNKGGFSLAELLVTLLIVSLVTSGVATGVQLAVGHYRRSMGLSESKVLCSTLSSIVQSELGSTREAQPGELISGTEYRLIGFFSNTYANTQDLSQFYSVDVNDSGISLSDDGYGEIILGVKSGNSVIGNLLVGSKSYSTYKLKARVNVTCTIPDGENYISKFHVTIIIKAPADQTTSTSFDVIPLNRIDV